MTFAFWKSFWHPSTFSATSEAIPTLHEPWHLPAGHTILVTMLPVLCASLCLPYIPVPADLSRVQGVEGSRLRMSCQVLLLCSLPDNCSSCSAFLSVGCEWSGRLEKQHSASVGFHPWSASALQSSCFCVSDLLGEKLWALQILVLLTSKEATCELGDSYVLRSQITMTSCSQVHCIHPPKSPAASAFSRDGGHAGLLDTHASFLGPVQVGIGVEVKKWARVPAV